MSSNTYSTSAQTLTWVSPTPPCASRAVFGTSMWTDQLANAPKPVAIAAANRKHAVGARAFEDPV